MDSMWKQDIDRMLFCIWKGILQTVFKCLAQMKFIIKSKVYCRFMELRIRLMCQKFPYHFQLQIHLIGREGLATGSP